MKKIFFAIAVLVAAFISQSADAQAVRGRISLPGFSLSVGNARPYYGYSQPGRFGGERRIAMQEAKIRDIKRMAWSDGFLSFPERQMIREEENRLDWMLNRRGY